MMNFLRFSPFRDQEEGSSAVEYAILLVIIALAIVAGALVFGEGISVNFSNSADKVANQIPTNPRVF